MPNGPYGLAHIPGRRGSPTSGPRSRSSSSALIVAAAAAAATSGDVVILSGGHNGAARRVLPGRAHALHGDCGVRVAAVVAKAEVGGHHARGTAAAIGTVVGDVRVAIGAVECILIGLN